MDRKKIKEEKERGRKIEKKERELETEIQTDKEK